MRPPSLDKYNPFNHEPMTTQNLLFKNAVEILNMEDGLYRKIDAISQSAVKQLCKSPAHYQHYISEPKEETDAMLLGTATHLAVFQPQHFSNEVIMMPKFDRRTKEGKLGHEQFVADNGNKIALTQDQYAQCIGMAEAVRSSPSFLKYTAVGNPEVTITADTLYDNVKAKGRLDWVNHEERVIIDLKTTSETANIYGIKSAIRKGGYDIQALYYIYLMKALKPDFEYRFVFCFVEKEAPYGVRLVEIIPSDLLFNVLPKVNASLETLSECLTNNVWPSYKDGITYIDIV